MTTFVVDANGGYLHAFETRCKRWSCPECARVNAAKLSQRTATAKPNRFITLTTHRKRDETPRQLYDWSRRQLSELAKQIRRDGREFEYVRVLETTKAGAPHYHLIARSSWIDSFDLSKMWERLTAARIVDIKRIHATREVTRYVTKYVTKQSAIPFTARRISWTRRFFPPQPERPQSDYAWCEWSQEPGGLDYTLRRHQPNARWEWINPYHAVKIGTTDDQASDPVKRYWSPTERKLRCQTDDYAKSNDDSF